MVDRTQRFIVQAKVKPLVAETNRIAAYVINRIGGTDFSISKLKKQGRTPFTWSVKGATRRGELSLESLSEHMRLNRGLNCASLGLPKFECSWLDGLVSIAKPDAPIATVKGDEYAKFALEVPYGEGFPFQPCIDREGTAYRTLQVPVLNNIVRLYDRLISDSHLIVSSDGLWLTDLRMLLNECVSIVDMTLHQLYFMAQYSGSAQGFRFDEKALGGRHGARLLDKFRWINKITGRPLSDAQNEVKSFVVLKDLRNHLSHFDPPCLAYTVEDAVSWLNRVPDVGRLLWKIRAKLNAQLNESLVAVILLVPVQFEARAPGPRVPQPPDVGYGSTNWGRVEANSSVEPSGEKESTG